MKVGSLFAGIGGIDLGFEQAGFDILWANEIDSDACKTYRRNFPDTYLIEGDIKHLDPRNLPQVDVLAAGFPCQPFSVCGQKKGFDDARGNLFFEIISKNDFDVFYQLYIIPMGTDFESLKLATAIRKKGIKTIIEMNNRKIKKAFEWANKNNIPYAVVIGENEITTKKIKIKDMNSYKEIEVEIDDIQKICEIINR